jgi:hypothetical protein
MCHDKNRRTKQTTLSQNLIERIFIPYILSNGGETLVFNTTSYYAMIPMIVGVGDYKNDSLEQRGASFMLS